MMTSLAFSMWGLGFLPGMEPLVGLLVYASGVYRLSIMKPADGNTRPFGLNYKIEYTDEPNMMTWVVEKYIRDCVSFCRRVNVKNPSSGARVDPKRWTSINFDLENGLSRFDSSSATNMGFLFRSNAANLKTLMEIPGVGMHTSFISEEIPDDLIVKYISAILTAPTSDYYGNIRNLIISEKQAQDSARKLLEEKKESARKLLEEKKKCSKVAGSKTRKCSKVAGRKTRKRETSGTIRKIHRETNKNGKSSTVYPAVGPV